MKHELILQGMNCGHCVKSVRETLESIIDLEVASVEIGRAVVEASDFAKIETEVKAKLEEEGYPVTEVKAA